MANLNNFLSNADSKVKLHEVRDRVHTAQESELNELLSDCARELFDLRTKAVTQQLENPMRVRHVRKLIARVKTELSARAAKVAA